MVYVLSSYVQPSAPWPPCLSVTWNSYTPSLVKVSLPKETGVDEPSASVPLVEAVISPFSSKPSTSAALFEVSFSVKSNCASVSAPSTFLVTLSAVLPSSTAGVGSYTLVNETLAAWPPLES